MSKWAEEFARTFGEMGTVKRLTKEIKDSADVKKMQDQADLNISKICKRRK